jgi:hypothetical protein
MKKHVFFFSVLFFTVTAFAQIEQGATYFGGMLGFNSGKTTFADNTPEIKTSGFDLGVSGNYLLTDQISVGLNLGFMSNGQSQNFPGVGDFEDTESAFGFGANARYFMGCCTPRFYTYADLGFNMMSGTSKSTSPFGETEDPFSAMNVGLSFGFMYFLCPSLALNLGFGNFGLESSKTGEGNGEVKTSNFGLNLSSETLRVGVSYFPFRDGQNF